MISKIKRALSTLGVLALCATSSQAEYKLKELDYEKYEPLMGEYFKESPEEFRKRMQWFDEVDRGMFVHFGLYSQLGGNWNGYEIPGNYAEWIWARVSGATPEDAYNYQMYLDLVKEWNPKDFNAPEIVKLAKELDMEYITIGSKHHEGFCLWPSEFTEFDIDATPMKGRDIMGEMAAACKEGGLRYGIYYSITDWYCAIKEMEEAGKEKPRQGGNFGLMPNDHEKYFEYMKNQLGELIDNYDPDLIWLDGDWVSSFLTPERGYELYEFIRSKKPSILVNERCISRRHPDAPKKDFGTLEKSTPSQEIIEKQQDPARRLYYEYCTSTQESWGHDRRIIQKTNDHYTSPQKMLVPYALMKTMHGNYLLNFGPDQNGALDPLAVKAARDFAKAANLLDEWGDYSPEAQEKALAQINYNPEDYKNPRHLSFTNPAAYERAVKIKRLIKETDKVKKAHREQKEPEKIAAMKAKLQEEMEAVAKESTEAQDPIQILNRVKELQTRFEKLP